MKALRIGAFIAVIGALLTASAAHAATLTVTSVADDGSSGTLRQVIASASTGDAIVFDPTTFTTARTIVETQGTIDIATSFTITGPSAGVAVDGNNANSVFTVTGGSASSPVVISSVTIQNGAGSDLDASGNADGGAMFNHGVVNLMNCTINHNGGIAGGGIYNDPGGVLTLNGCTLSNNASGAGANFLNGVDGAGGAIYNGGDLTATNCIVKNNSSQNGGGIENEGACNLIGCIISNNGATFNGGGLDNIDSAMLANCTISGNSSSEVGGGVEAEGTILLTGCTISDNSTFEQGGGIDGGATLTNCTLSNNSSSDIGGGMYVEASSTLTNCTLTGNGAGGGGGGIYFLGVNTLTLTNCTLTGNSDTAIYLGYNTSLSGTTILKNCILYGDPDGETYVDVGTLSASNCDFQGTLSGTFGIVDDGGNIDENPLLGTLANNGGAAQTMALGSSSPCFAAGRETGAPSEDERGYLRPNPPSIGAYDGGTVTGAAILTPQSSVNGTIAPAVEQAVPYGETQTFSATAAAGYVLSGWTVDGAPAPGNATLTDGTIVAESGLALTFSNVQGSHSVSAVFATSEDTLTPQMPANGAFSPPTAQTVRHGALQTFRALPNAGYILDIWTVDGIAVTGITTLSDGTMVDASGLTFTFSNVQGNHEVAASFKLAVIHTFQPGIQMISVPTDYTSESLATVLGYSSPVLAVWQPSASTYAVTPAPLADSLVAGQGYWVRIPASGATVTAVGTEPPTAFTFQLARGWNMIGCPQLSAVPVSSLTVTDSSNVSHTFADAASSGIVEDPLFTFQAGDVNYELVTAAAGSLQPYYGYWLYASQVCTLSFPVGE